LVELKILIELYIAFFKIGAYTFGGGQAMIPFIQRETVEVKKWVTELEMIDIITVSQSMPGAVAINSATAIGYKLYGIRGAMVATLGMITPSLFIIIVVAKFFDNIQNNDTVLKIFEGIRSGVIALIFIAFMKIFKSGVKDKYQIMIFFITVTMSLIFKIYPPYLILFGACMYVMLERIKARKG
jgi:chromate transporter